MVLSLGGVRHHFVALGCGAHQLSGGHGGGSGSGGVNCRIVGGVCVAHVVLVGAVPWGAT